MSQTFEDIFPNTTGDGAIWVAVKEMIQTSLALLPHGPHKLKVAFPPDLGSLSAENEKALRLKALGTLLEHSAERRKAVAHCLREKEWPDMSADAALRIAIASEQIVRFLDLCAVGSPGIPASQDAARSVFGFYTDNLAKLALWFFFEWWPAVGAAQWVEDVASNERALRAWFDPAE